MEFIQDLGIDKNYFKVTKPIKLKKLLKSNLRRQIVRKGQLMQANGYLSQPLD